tara:strand:- start:176 stop:361 length:186 start_codon:yes stop_codon:yes gene_type:complete
MSKYTDDEIAEACMECIDDWDMKTLLQFAYDEMYHHYTEVAKADSLDAFMQKDDEEEYQDG